MHSTYIYTYTKTQYSSVRTWESFLGDSKAITLVQSLVSSEILGQKKTFEDTMIKRQGIQHGWSASGSGDVDALTVERGFVLLLTSDC